MTLFKEANGQMLPNPRNQHELVIYTLIHCPAELTIGYWWDTVRSGKLSSRLGEIEKDLQRVLVDRQSRKFVNRFGHKSEYTAYVPILKESDYIEIYLEMQSKK